MADEAAMATLLDVDISENITSELDQTMTPAHKSLLDSCPIWTDPDRELLYAFSFWVEGVSQGFKLYIHLSTITTTICTEYELPYLPSFY